MDVGQLITQAEASRRLEARPYQIQRWIDAGRLDVAYTECGLRLVTVASVDRLKEERASR